MKQYLSACILILLTTSGHTEMTPLMKNSLRFSMAQHGVVSKGDKTAFELTAPAPSDAQENFTKKIDAFYIESPAAMAWLMWRDGKLIYERYGAPELATSLTTTFSVSKTLNAMMVGRALCDGKIKSLDDLASTYETRLIGTPYEKNTIRSLLTMTTGVEHQPAQGGADLNSLWRGEKTTLETITDKRRLPFQESYFLRKFNYDNAASNALGLTVRAATGIPLSEYFSQNFYQASQPVASGRWLRDKAGEEFAMGSFLAIPRDHLRLGIHILKIIRGEAGDQCIQNYSKQLIAKAVDTTKKPILFGSDTGYGFQIWTNLTDMAPDTVEMRGNAGQHIFVSPSTSTVILILTAADHRMDERSMLNAKEAAKVLLGK